MKTLPRKIFGLAAIVTLVSGVGIAEADPTSVAITPSNNPNIAGMTNLYRHPDGIGMTATVTGLRGGDGLPGGHPYTVWAVIFNFPAECANYPMPCTPDDFDPAGPTQTRVTQFSRNYSDAAGNGFFSGFLPEGDALFDAESGEVHLVFRRHPDRNPEYVSLNMVGGNCQFVNGELVDGPKNNQCEDEGFAIHQP